MTIKIGVITHKKFDDIKSEIFIPLHVGKKGKDDLGYIGDDTGENISEKNSNYCELTGQYWMWKNWTNLDYKGLCHYRRYFIVPTRWNDFKYNFLLFIKKVDGFLKNKKSWTQRISKLKKNQKLKNYIRKSEEFLKGKLYQYDVVLLKEFELNKTLEVLYKNDLVDKDLITLRDVIFEKYPEYVKDFDMLINQNKLSPCNMFIAKKEIFNEYSEWLFDILFEVEKRVEIPNDVYKARVFGFMGEYLLNVYFNKHKEYKVLKMDMLFIK